MLKVTVVLIPIFSKTLGCLLINLCKLAYTCDLDSALNSSASRTITPQGRTPDNIPVRLFIKDRLLSLYLAILRQNTYL